ncbi:MAG: hypothetical protein WA957_17575, partial [Alteraurantiacibacter sp.]
CLSDDEQKVDRTSQVTINFQGFTSNGVTAGMNIDRGADFSGGIDTSLVFIGEAISFPILMRGRHNDARFAAVPQDFQVSITQDGRMLGERKLQWTVDQRQVDVTCTFRLAAAG